jgi:L-ribulokinase
VEEAQAALCGVRAKAYQPAAAARQVYDELYRLYRQLHDAFGRADSTTTVGRVMKELIELRERRQSSA